MKEKTMLILAAALAAIFAVVWVPWHLTFDTHLAQDRLTTFFSGMLAMGSVLTAIAVIAAFAQVREAKNQLIDNRAWNRMSFALTTLPSWELISRLELELDATFVKISSRAEPISDHDVLQLFQPENRHVHLLLKTFLNALETYCVAVNAGLAHEDISKRVVGYKLVRHFVELRPYITYQRKLCRDDRIFSEIETVWSKWAKEIDAIPAPFASTTMTQYP